MAASQIKIFAGNTNRALALSICAKLRVKLSPAVVDRFPGGETHVELGESVMGRDVYIIEPICANAEGRSPNDALMELLTLIDAAARSGAEHITAVIPYFGYARQDRKDKPRVPITAKLVANLLQSAGATRVITLNLHTNQIQGFFDIPVNHLYAINIFSRYIKNKKMRNLIIISPDAGGAKMTRAYAEIFNCPIAIIDKRRAISGQAKVMNIIGEVAGKRAIIVDDLISTGGTIVDAARTLRKKGALDVMACIVHPVLADDAAAKIQSSDLSELVVTDSIPLSARESAKKIKVLSVAPIFSEAIKRVHAKKPVSTLFSDVNVEG